MLKRKLILINPISSYSKKTTFSGFKGMMFPPLSLSYIAALTPNNWDVEILDESVEEFNKKDADLIGITAFTTNVSRAYEISEMYRANNIPVVMGGIHISMLPEEALNYCDSVVIGEAESVWPKLINDFENSKLKQKYIGEHLQLDKQLIPRRDLLSPKYKLASIQTTRGCPFDCNFCSVTQFNGGRYRARPIEHVIEELKTISQKNLLIADDNVLGNKPEHKERALKLFKAMVKNRIKKTIIVQSSIDIGEDEEVLYYAAKSGVKLIIMGFESINPESLNEMNKKLNEKNLGSYQKVVETIHKHGIGVYASFIMGSDTDDKDTIKTTTQFSLKNKIDLPVFTVLTPLPGTKLYEKMRDRLVFNNYPKDWDRYNFVEPVHKMNLSRKKFLKKYVVDWGKDFFTLRKIFMRAFITLKETKKPLTTFLVTYMNLGFHTLIKAQYNNMVKEPD